MLGALSHSHYMALAFGGTFLINEPSLQTTSLFHRAIQCSRRLAGLANRPCHRRSPLTTLSPLAARSSLAVLLPLATFFCRVPLANGARQRSTKPVKRYEHLTGDLRIEFT